MFHKREINRGKEEKQEFIDHPLSTSLEKPVAKLFPLNNGYVAAAISHSAFTFTKGSPAYSLQIYDTTARTSGLLNCTKSYGSGTSYKPYVMSDGYFFHSVDKENRNMNCYESALLYRVDNDSSVSINEALYPSIAANISTSSERLDLVCATENRDKLYVYDFPMVEVLIDCYGYGYRKEFQPSSWEKPHAEITFTATDGVKVNSIAACILEKNIHLAIALDNGTLQLSKLVNHNLVDTICLDANAEKNPDKIQLFATAQGLLLAYEADQARLRIWDMKKNCQLTEHKCPQLFDVSISATGDYFTGLVSAEDAKSDQLFLLDLKSLQQQTVKLDKPVAHCVLGYKNYMCSAYESTIRYTGHISKLLPKAPEPAPVEKSTPSATGFFSRMLSAFQPEHRSKEEKSEHKSLRN